MLKRNFILVMACIFSLNAFSQKLAINELRSFNKMNMQDFRTAIKEKYNYSYSDKTESSEFNLYQYSNFSNNVNRAVGKFEYTNDASKNSIEYTTTDKVEFNSNLTAILKLGYKETGKGKIMGGGTYKDYTLNKETVRFVLPKKQVNTTFKTADEFSIVVSN